MVSAVGVSVQHLSCLALLTLLLSSCGGTPEPAASASAAEPARASRIQRAAKPKPPKPLPPENVLFALQPALGELRACLTDPGAIRLQWRVDQRGNASDFDVLWSEQPDTQVKPCLAELIAQRSFQLPQDEQTAIASWTFVRDLKAATSRTAKSSRKRRARNEGVQFDPPGRLDADEVNGIVQSGMRLYAHCLRAAVEEESSVGGKLALSWLVDERGQPSDVTDAGSDIDNDAVVDCAAECFYALKFPVPNGGAVKVTYALLFNED